MLVQNSTPLATRAELEANGGAANDFGLTTPPANFQAPTFNIVSTQVPNYGWSASLQILKRAAEGDNEAYHLLTSQPIKTYDVNRGWHRTA